ncbi:D-alanine--D-alanine ligase [Aequorivita antarctica]|uniref:D-alanine--D-alanine ligase n=1 Tax=Aequorivita antarctica TaxID=153266 RepID=A0A5C6Z0P7_9FLAO|nr:D-alanine--D-alanine ligase [Aequorivita antarctica]TXD73030.1 D-alanine--D-alanine ligase [Aequorivita antarctica]SRX74564.1 D-alanine--D-alanine ligase [Aequorivita antarctica]
MGKKHIAVAMGGYSSEFEISINSGGVVCNALDKSKYEVYPIHILEEGWYFVAKNGTKHPVNKADFSFNNGTETIHPDAVFNTIHGTPGEDGYLQAYWELLGIPHTSTDYYQAALSFNKRDCLSVLKNFGVRAANSYYVNEGTEINLDEVILKTGLPCFVKPNRSGSSFGISKVNNMNEIMPAIEKAFTEDTEIIIETAIVGIEVSVGVYNNGKEIIALPVTEIVSENEFFDYEAKYLGKSQEITPARISEEETEMVKKEAIRIYKLLNMKGITRSEFIIEKGKPYFLEINTNPGLSTESIIPKQAREAGMTLTEFFDILIQNVLK